MLQSLELGVISADNFSSVYPVLNDYINQNGNLVTSRNGNTFEILDFKTQITNPYQRCVGGCKRNINIFFLLAEAIWIASGQKDVQFLTIFNQNMSEFSDDGLVFHAPYGFRIRNWNVHSNSSFSTVGKDQLLEVIDILSKQKDSRRAVMSIWNPTFDLNVNSKDLPCNDMVFFKIRDNELITTIANRSNDLHWGLPTNIFQFSFLSELISLTLNIELGTQTHNSQSLHVYEWNDISKIMETEFKGNYKELYQVSDANRIDFKFQDNDPSKRMYELDNVMQGIIHTIKLFSLFKNEENFTDKESVYKIHSLEERSVYFKVIYELLKIYVSYKKKIKTRLFKKEDLLKESLYKIIDNVEVQYEGTSYWDIVILAKNFFASRISDYKHDFIGKL